MFVTRKIGKALSRPPDPQIPRWYQRVEHPNKSKSQKLTQKRFTFNAHDRLLPPAEVGLKKRRARSRVATLSRHIKSTKVSILVGSFTTQEAINAACNPKTSLQN
jgi:hypothetical protein